MPTPRSRTASPVPFESRRPDQAKHRTRRNNEGPVRLRKLCGCPKGTPDRCGSSISAGPVFRRFRKSRSTRIADGRSTSEQEAMRATARGIGSATDAARVPCVLRSPNEEGRQMPAFSKFSAAVLPRSGLAPQLIGVPGHFGARCFAVKLRLLFGHANTLDHLRACRLLKFADQLDLGRFRGGGTRGICGESRGGCDEEDGE